MKPTYARALIFSLSAALLTLWIVGCAGSGPAPGANRYDVRLVTEPEGVSITVASSGRTIPTRALGGTTTATLTFSDRNPTVSITASPAGELLLTHERTELSLSEPDIEAIEPGPDGVRAYTIQVQERAFIDMPAFEAFYHPDRGWIALETWHRAHATVLEQDGTLPEEIDVLLHDDFDGIRGIDIVTTSDGERVAYGLFSVGPKADLPAPEPQTTTRAGAVAPAPPPAEPEDLYTREIDETQIFARKIVGTGRAEFTERDDLVQIDPSPTVVPSNPELLYALNAQRRRLGYTDIFARKLRAAGGRSLRSAGLPDGSAARPSHGLTPDGSDRLVFEFIPFDTEGLSDSRVFTKLGAGGFHEDLMRGIQPKVSADAARIAYIRSGELHVSKSSGADDYQLTEDSEGLRAAYRQTLTERHGEVFDAFEDDFVFTEKSHPNWSRDGRYVVFTSYVEDGNPDGRPQQDVFIMPADGSLPPVRVTTNPSADRHPMITSDGRSIVFVSNRGKRWAVWRVANPLSE